MKKLIYNFKYKPYVSDLTRFLGDLFFEGFSQHEGFQYILEKVHDNQVFLTAVPLHKQKIKQRGYNTSLLLAKELGKRFHIPVISLLERVRVTRTQVGLSRDARRENVKGAFAILKRNKEKLADSTIFLVDDVVTTGATLSEAAKVLKKAGAEAVYGLALASEQ